ncbi:hypothetical protein ACWCO3_15315 [Micromonospora sp. NPDC002411]
MRDADTPPQEPTGTDNARAEPTPRQQAAAIRVAAAQVGRRVQEWRYSQGWHDTPTNVYRHQATVAAVAALDALPEPTTADELARFVDAVQPLFIEWRPNRPGPEQQIFVAIERLRRACR